MLMPKRAVSVCTTALTFVHQREIQKASHVGTTHLQSNVRSLCSLNQSLAFGCHSFMQRFRTSSQQLAPRSVASFSDKTDLGVKRHLISFESAIRRVTHIPLHKPKIALCNKTSRQSWTSSMNTHCTVAFKHVLRMLLPTSMIHRSATRSLVR